MFKTVFEDNQILVIDKEPGLVVTSSTTQRESTLEEILKNQLGRNLERSGIVHRLDKDTSGLLVIAKTEQAQVTLQAQFKERVVKKEYWALVHGWIKGEGSISVPISRNPVNREKFTVGDENLEGKSATTFYKPLRRLFMTDQRLKEIFSDLSKPQFSKLITNHYQLLTLLSCSPLTGRTHQIRVHLKYLNFPIVADEKYGGRKTVRLDRRWCPRQFLHAKRLEFNHPKTLERLSFESDLPDDLKDVLKLFEDR